LFHNQPADRLLDVADLVITVGYNPIEYDVSMWNKGTKRPIIHIDAVSCDIDTVYNPAVELTGDIAETLLGLMPLLAPLQSALNNPLLTGVIEEVAEIRKLGAQKNSFPIHPLRIVTELQPFLEDDVTLCLDMGSFHIWHARYLHVFQPRQMLISNGQQTLGVGMPWAIAACLARPGQKVISVSGDGGFHFSSVELETAVRLKCNFVHIIWCDGSYDMVRFQEKLKYGRSSGVDFGVVDNVKFAEAMGATGFRITSPDEISSTLKKAMAMSGPVVIEIPVDYSHNFELGQKLHSEFII
jgi:acetolactate synthase-1/2/3 large subunit